ncbi:MAG: SDR family NAD(P)-dependent oxidoreductase, partial [Vicinamibacterales bacterium]
MTNPLDFTGKVALVTGAAAGMGLATARAFTAAGAAVVLADVNEDAVRAE